MVDQPIILSFTALAGGLAWAAWSAVALWRGSQPGRVTSLIPLAVSLVLLAAAGIYWTMNGATLLSNLNLMAAMSAVAYSLAVQFLPLTCVARRRRLVIGYAWLVAAVVGNFQLVTSDAANAFLPDIGAAKVPVDDAVLVTDQGRIFGVFRYEAERYVDNALEIFGDKLVRVAAADLTSNCHGWVFANGRYAVPDTAVAALLEDNGYAAVTAPWPGDVIVYRDEANRILHSGQVRRVHDDGQIWIESKWGPGGRYLHRPEDQCYSGLFTYYRSGRLEHGAQIVQQTARKDSRVARSDAPIRRAGG